MNLFNLYHSQEMHKKSGLSDFRLFELSIALHVIASSLVSVFIPILLLTIGYSLTEVIIFYLIYNAFDVPLNFLARKLVYKMGARWVVVLGTICAMLFFGTFSLLGPQSWLLITLLAALYALYDSLYWVSHLYLFIEGNTDKEKSGKNTGMLYAIRNFARLLSPAIGAALLIFANADALLYLSIFIFICSLIPLLKVDDFPDRPTEPSKSFKIFFNDPREQKNFISSFLFAFHSSAEGVLWPLFIYITFESIQSVALIPIIVSITSIVFSVVVGRVGKERRERMVMLGAGMIILVWLVRLFFDIEIFYYISIFLVGLFTLLVTIPIDSNLIRRARDVDALSASTYRNAFNMLARFLLYLGLFVSITVFNMSFIVAMVMLVILILINYLFIHYVHCEHDECKVLHS